jgi:hypothetical protein
VNRSANRKKAGVEKKMKKRKDYKKKKKRDGGRGREKTRE